VTQNSRSSNPSPPRCCRPIDPPCRTSSCACRAAAEPIVLSPSTAPPAWWLTTSRKPWGTGPALSVRSSLEPTAPKVPAAGCRGTAPGPQTGRTQGDNNGQQETTNREVSGRFPVIGLGRETAGLGFHTAEAKSVDRPRSGRRPRWKIAIVSRRPWSCSPANVAAVGPRLTRRRSATPGQQGTPAVSERPARQPLAAGRRTSGDRRESSLLRGSTPSSVGISSQSCGLVSLPRELAQAVVAEAGPDPLADGRGRGAPGAPLPRRLADGYFRPKRKSMVVPSLRVIW
jgi:hypothetical protein